MTGRSGRFVPGVAMSLCLAGFIGTAPSDGVVAGATNPLPATRPQLVGTWELVSVEVIGPNGRRSDPFYGAGPSGVLIYDASGWMSVQIAGKSRPTMEAHASRPGNPHTEENARIEAAVLDTYYAYAARWAYDGAVSQVTHHVEMSLIPGEVGKSYSQTVQWDHGNLIFTVPRDDLGDSTVQEKVWRRAGSR